MQNEIIVGLNIEGALNKLDRLRREAAAVKAEIEGGGGPATPGQSSQIAGLLGQAASTAGGGSIQGTAASTVSGGPTSASMQASLIAAGASRSQVELLMGAASSPTAAASIARQLGFALPGAAVPSQPQYMPPAADFTKTLVMPAVTPRNAWGGVLPAGYSSTGPWPSGMGGVTQDPTIMMDPAMLALAGSGGGPFTRWGGGRMAGMMSLANMRLTGAGLGLGAYSAMSVSGGETISGHRDIGGEARTMGMLIGGGLGMLSGNPIVAGAAAIGGGAVMEWMAAPMVRSQQVMASLLGIQGALEGPDTASASYRGRWAVNLSDQIYSGRGGWAFGGPGNRLSAQAISGGMANIGEAMISGGMDPTRLVGGRVMPTTPRFDDPEGAFTLGRWGARTVRFAIESMMAAADPGAEAMRVATKRLGYRYPDDDALKTAVGRVTPIYSTLPETGGNIVDILMKHGPLAAYTYGQSRTDPAYKPEDSIGGMGLTDMSRMSATFRGFGRTGAIASTQARGAARGLEYALRSQMETLAGVDGGMSSQIYRETAAAARGAGAGAFEAESAISFGVPHAVIAARREIAQASPFSPGNRFGIELESLQLNRGRRAQLTNYMNRRSRAGELSEAEQLDITQQILGLDVANARSVAALSEGVENRLPALSAGRPPSFGRFDSAQLAAFQFGRAGSPVRRWGAVSGRQARMQDEFASSFGGGSMNPRSPMGDGINNPEVVAYLAKIERHLEKLSGGGSSFQRMRRGPGDMPPGGGYAPGGHNLPAN